MLLAVPMILLTARRRCGCCQVGEDDATPYTVLFEQVFAPLTPERRRELLRSPDYGHLAASAPDGAFAAFCELSMSREEWSLGSPRYAWVDYIGTGEARQRLGLAQALLHEGMRRLRALGVERVAVITMGSNERARSVYRRGLLPRRARYGLHAGVGLPLAYGVSRWALVSPT